MRRSVLTLFVTVVLVIGGIALLSPGNAGSQGARNGERWVNANLLQVQVAGTWHDVPMVPLADHLCRGGYPQFDRYCH